MEAPIPFPLSSGRDEGPVGVEERSIVEETRGGLGGGGGEGG